MKLTAKQKKFADKYIETGNATQSAISAGYSSKYANTNASKLLQNTAIKSYIDEKMQEIESKSIMSAVEALQFLTNVIRGKELETKVVATQNDVQEVQVPADIKTKISAVREILKRYPGNDKLLMAQLRRTEAEADMARFKADALEGKGESNPILEAMAKEAQKLIPKEDK